MQVVQRIFVAAGVPEDQSRLVAELLVKVNLSGVYSHGVIRVPQYLPLGLRKS